jgi:hypothetical protein
MNISKSNFTDATDVQWAGGLVVDTCPYFNISHSTISGHISTGITIDFSPYSTIYSNTVGPNDLPTNAIMLGNSNPYFNITRNVFNNAVGIGDTAPYIAHNMAVTLGFGNANPIVFNNSIGSMLITNFSNATIINNTIGNIDLNTNSNATIINNTIGSMDMNTNSNATIINNTIGSMDMNTNSSATIINSTLTGLGIALLDSYAWVENTIINGGDVIHSYNSNAFVINSTLNGSMFLSSDSHITALNVTGSVFEGNYLVVEDTSNITLKNYLHIQTLNETLLPIQSTDIKVEEDDIPIYASSGFGGINPRTNINGIN